MTATDQAITSRFLKNSAALMAIQLSNYALPFVLIPYLTRILGLDIYGVYGFVLAVFAFSYVLTDFGFGLSSVPVLVGLEKNLSARNKYITSVFIIKIVLCVLVFMLLHGFMLLNDKYSTYETVIYIAMLTVLGQAFQPVWYFQAIEKMAYITLYTFFARVFYVVMVFTFVRSKSDLFLLIFLNGLSQVIAAIIAIAIMVKKDYLPSMPLFSDIVKVVNGAWGFFVSRIAVSFYTSFPALYFGIFSTNHQMAIYTAAEQIYKGCQSLASPLAEALYPSMLKNKKIEWYKKILRYVVLVVVFAGLLGLQISDHLVDLVFGPEFNGAVPVLNVFILALVVNIPSVLLGYPLLGALGFAKLVNSSVLIAGVLQVAILLALFAMNIIDPINVSISILMVELVVLVLRSYRAYEYLKNEAV